ncbi:Serine protease family s01a, partial [Globisporangium splendens]
MKVATILRVGVFAAIATAVSAYDFSSVRDDADASSGVNTDTDLTDNEEQRIYGGSEADASLYPYIVSLRKSADGSTYCGGSLIAPQYVVTAAHCVKTTVTMYASIGSKYSSGTAEGERIAVTESYVHPKYESAAHLYDVAILKLASPSTITPVPLCAADGSDNKENTMAVVRGWGMTETGVAASTLQEVNVRMITNAVCNKSYSNRITEGMLCAGEGGGKDSCQGDSGGPLVSNNKLVGLVSWGGKCGAAPGVYTRVSYVLDFINEKIGGGSATNSSSPAAGSGSTAAVTPVVTPAPATASSSGSAATGESVGTTPVPTETPSVAPITPATTDAPVTEAPATPAPVTEAPATAAPSVTPVTPVTAAPATTAPVTTAPVTDAPSSDAAAQTDVSGSDSSSGLVTGEVTTLPPSTAESKAGSTSSATPVTPISADTAVVTDGSSAGSADVTTTAPAAATTATPATDAPAAASDDASTDASSAAYDDASADGSSDAYDDITTDAPSTTTDASASAASPAAQDTTTTDASSAAYDDASTDGADDDVTTDAPAAGATGVVTTAAPAAASASGSTGEVTTAAPSSSTNKDAAKAAKKAEKEAKAAEKATKKEAKAAEKAAKAAEKQAKKEAKAAAKGTKAEEKELKQKKTDCAVTPKSSGSDY